MLAILQTAAAAVAAYYVALLLPLDDNKPVFASIAAVISIGASYHQRGRRAVELVAGVVVGLTVADLIIHAIGTGPLQIGLMIVIAMSAALAWASRCCGSARPRARRRRSRRWSARARATRPIVSSKPSSAAWWRSPSPRCSSRPTCAGSSRARRRPCSPTSARRWKAWPVRSRKPIPTARRTPCAPPWAIETDLAAFDEAVVTAREMVRFAPPRRGARSVLERHAGTLPHVDFAVGNTGVLARHALRYTRSRLVAPDGLIAAIRDLEQPGRLRAPTTTHSAPRRRATAHASPPHGRARRLRRNPTSR